MEKLRTILKEYGKWESLEEYCRRIEGYLEDDFIIAVENSKSLIESICKTILEEHNVTYSRTEKLNKLFSNTLKTINIFGKEQISKFGSGLITAIQNLGELRNKIGDTAHGKSIYENKKNKIGMISTNFLINSIEVIACFLIEYNEQEYPDKKEKEELNYENFMDFNNYFDNINGNIEFSIYSYPASEVLFYVDSTAYKVALQEFDEKKDDIG